MTRPRDIADGINRIDTSAADATAITIDSSENVGIGTSSPSALLGVNGRLTLGDQASSGTAGAGSMIVGAGALFIQASENQNSSTKAPIVFSNIGGSSESMRIDSSGNLGIGTSSPACGLHVDNPDNGAITAILDTDNSAVKMVFRNNTETGNNVQIGADGSNLVALTGATERMRIDSSGNLLVGRTSASSATAGFTAQSDGAMYNAYAGRPYYVNRLSSDGTIIEFAKDGTTIGTIGSFGGNTIVIDGEASIYCANNVRPNAQDTHDLGSASYRWRDIYTNGAVNTSDQNEKQQIAELTATELAAAKRISALFKTFKWNNAVEAKGDNARTHTGVIAQDVRDALVAEGLDASNYAFWCSDTWWEHDVEVPAVEAVEAQDAVLDDDGNIVSEAVEAVEAQAAYTRTDIYETADEAPEGAIERTQQSVRYNELMAFVGAATEQRLADIETRLTTLENT